SQLPGVAYQFRKRPDGTCCLPYASEGIREIYRLGAADVRDDATPILRLIHPDDLDSVRHSVDESGAKLTPWHSVYRVCSPDGAPRWPQGNSVPQRDPDGSTLWHGFITDVTDRKRDEEPFHAVNKRFELARRSLRIGVWDWDICTNEIDWDEGMY